MRVPDGALEVLTSFASPGAAVKFQVALQPKLGPESPHGSVTSTVAARAAPGTTAPRANAISAPATAFPRTVAITRRVR
jgi:hypothetical protein